MIQAKDIVLVDPNQLKPNPKNRNIHPVEQITRLVELIKYQGFRAPVVVSKRTDLVVAGHGRLMAALKMGLTEVPVSYQDFADEQQEVAYGISDNAIGAWAELDISNIMLDMKEFDVDFDFDLFAVKNLDLSSLQPEPPGDPDEVGEPPAEPKSKPGDVYVLGTHRLMCGDSLKIDDVLKLMNGEVADMVWTDPPYNVAVQGGNRGNPERTDGLRIENDSMDDKAFYKFLYDVYICLYTATKPGGAIYVAHADSEGINFRQAMKDANWLLKQCLIWKKNSLVMSRQDYHWKHEPILYGWKPGAAHNWHSDRKQTTVLEFNRPLKNGEHPTMKPIDLVEYCINNSSANGDIVLDVFGGSGTTMIAAEKNFKRGFLMELDPKYCDVIVNRFVKYTGKSNIIRNGEPIDWEVPELK